MEIEDLKTFVEVANAGGVSSAARRLGVAKSIISRRLFRLEDELGSQLLSRSTRGAVLTEAGMSFRERAVRICEEIEAAREELSSEGDLRGLLRVAGPASFGQHFAPVLATFAVLHPLLQIHTRYSDRYVDLVAEGFDCGIRVGYLPDSNLVARRIGSFCVSLYASPIYINKNGAPTKPEDVFQHQAVLIGTESWKFSIGKKTTSINPHGRFKSDSAIAIAEAIAAGVGIGALPDVIAAKYSDEGKLRPIMSGYRLPEVGIFIVRPPGQHLARKVRALIGLLVDHFARPR